MFAGHTLWQRHVDASDYTITVTAEEMERQALIFAGENRRQPTDDDLKALLSAHVEEQALVREARQLGLGEEDTIIHRRLAQKMRFIIEDVDTPELPDDAALKAWFDNNLDKFSASETRSFSHIFFSPSAHGEDTETLALKALAQIRSNNPPPDWVTLGDPFMLKRKLKGASQAEVARAFGSGFSAGVFNTESMDWQGPMKSAFGLHLIKLDKITPETIPHFENVRSMAEKTWYEDAQRAANKAALKNVIEKYQVNVLDKNVRAPSQ